MGANSQLPVPRGRHLLFILTVGHFPALSVALCLCLNRKGFPFISSDSLYNHWVRRDEYWPIRARSLAAARHSTWDPPTIPPWTFCAAQPAFRSGLLDLTSSKPPLGTRPSTGSRCSNLPSAGSLYSYSASILHLPGSLPFSPFPRAVNL